jgi:hypothetical protein
MGAVRVILALSGASLLSAWAQKSSAGARLLAPHPRCRNAIQGENHDNHDRKHASRWK